MTSKSGKVSPKFFAIFVALFQGGFYLVIRFDERLEQIDDRSA